MPLVLPLRAPLILPLHGYGFWAGRPSWAPPSAAFAGDLLGGRYWRTARPTCVRASDGYAQTAGGVWTRFGPGELRLTDRGLLVPEPAATELDSNNQMTGAVIGTATLPVGWSTVGAGLIKEVVATGMAGGIAFVDIRLHSGGASIVEGSWWIRTSASLTGIVGEIHTQMRLAMIATPAVAGLSFTSIYMDNPGGAPAVLENRTSLTAELTEFSDAPIGTIVTPGTSLAPWLRWHFTPSVRDFTVRVAWPSYRTSPIDSLIATTGASATRAADTVSITAPAGSYALHLVMDDASETVLPGWTPATPLPLTLTQGKYVTSYYGVVA